MNRPNPALPITEQLYVGLYSSDCVCQTSEEEIIPLKNTTELLSSLYREIEVLKAELKFTRESLRSSFYQELQTHGQDIYYQLLDRLEELRKNHVKAVEQIRLSYRSQLQDFISQARNIILIDKPVQSNETGAPKKRSNNDGQEKLLFQQAAIKGYESEIANLKKDIENLQDSMKHEIKIATAFLTDEKERLLKDLSVANRSLGQLEDALAKRDEQIRDLKRDLNTTQSRLKETKKVTVREPTPTPVIATHSRLAQTDPWEPTVQVVEKAPEPSRDLESAMKSKVDGLEQRYQSIIEQKNAQIQQLMQELDAQQRSFKAKLEKYPQMEERHRSDMKRYAEKHKQEVQAWETKYEILKKSMIVLREEMYTRQTHVRDRFTAKAAVVTYN